MKKLLLLLMFTTLGFAQTKTTVTGVVQDASGNLATSGTVVFNLSPQNSGIIYFVTGTGIIAPQTGTCGIDGSGNIKNLALSGACQVWGTDLIQPANLTYQVAFFPNGVESPTNTVAQQCITGVTYNLSNPKFCPVIKPTPQGAVVITSPIQNNLIPSADAVFNLGSASLRYGNIFAANGTFTNNIVAPNIPSGTVNTGTGTTNTIPKYTNGATGVIGNSSVTDNGTTVSTSEVMAALGLNINSTGLLSTTAQSGTGSICMTTNCVMTTPALGAATATSLIISGKITNSNWNNVRVVDGNTLLTIQGCINALPALGGTCLVPPLDPVSGQYLETLTANIVQPKNVVVQFLGQCQITEGAFNWQMPQGADDATIITPFAHSSDQAGGAQGCALVGYTGSTAAVDIGSSAGFTYNTSIRGLDVNLFSAQAGAVGFRRTNGVGGPMEYDEVVFGPVSGQVGFQFVGTGALFDGTSNIIGPECTSSPSSTNNKCLQWTGTNQNGYAMLGGHANMGGSANGSICLDVAAGTSRVDPGGFYCDVAATALTVESTANTAVSGKLWVDSGVTAMANFAAGSNGNRIETNTRSIGTQLVTDNGIAGTNSVFNSFDNQVNSRRFRMTTDVSFTGFGITDVSDGSLAFGKSVGSIAQMNASNGNAIRLNPNFGDGVEFWNRNTAAAVLVVDVNGIIHPAAVNAIGLGTAALPFLNTFLGTAATNNFKITPAVTSAARTININDPGVATVNMGLVIASGTAVMPVTAFGAAGCNTAVTVAATGVLTTDTIIWDFTADPGATVGYSTGALHIYPYVTAGNVNFRQCSSVAVTPGAATLNWRVVR